MKKLIKSPFFDLFGHNLTSEEEEDVSTKALGAPTMLLEEGAVANALRQHLFVNVAILKNYNSSTP